MGSHSELRQLLLAAALCTLVAVALAAPLTEAASPPFAREGAFASYTTEGGFIPYFSGVSGNITYTVVGVYPNGSMLLRIFENITAGTDLPPILTTLNATDRIQNPRVFPSVPLANLTSGRVFFQNVSASYLQNATVSVPAGQFNTMEFTGQGANDTTTHFWFEAATGLVVEENAGTSAVELDSSNIATPIAPSDLYATEVPYLLVFVSAFAIGGGSFLWLRHHYTKSAAKDRGQSGPPSPSA